MKGISIAEIEFPIYYNFFLKKRRTTIICREDQFEQMKKVLQEAVFGPKEFDIAGDYDPSIERRPACPTSRGRWIFSGGT